MFKKEYNFYNITDRLGRNGNADFALSVFKIYAKPAHK